jgi:hypothetical protein
LPFKCNLQRYIVGAARVLGAYVPPIEWLPLSLEAITGGAVHAFVSLSDGFLLAYPIHVMYTL